MKKKVKEAVAAYHLGCSVHALQKWRRTGQGPPFYKVGRCVLYAPEDLDAFLEKNKFESTAQYGEKNV